MPMTNPREWVFQGWIAWRIPWFPDPLAVTGIGNALLSHFPNMKEVVYDEGQRRISIGEYRENVLRASLDITAANISFRLFQLENAEEWREFNLPVLRILQKEAKAFEAKFNLLQLRQHVYIRIRQISSPGKKLYQLIGNRTFCDAVAGKDSQEDMGMDLEFILPESEGSRAKTILRLQTPGPTAVWMASDELLVTLTVSLDPQPDVIDSIDGHWENAQNRLLEQLRSHVYPNVVEYLIQNLG